MQETFGELFLELTTATLLMAAAQHLCISFGLNRTGDSNTNRTPSFITYSFGISFWLCSLHRSWDKLWIRAIFSVSCQYLYLLTYTVWVSEPKDNGTFSAHAVEGGEITPIFIPQNSDPIPSAVSVLVPCLWCTSYHACSLQWRNVQCWRLWRFCANLFCSLGLALGKAPVAQICWPTGYCSESGWHFK